LTGLESLRRSESRYRLLYERNVDGILMVDPQTQRVVLANPAACSTLGYSSQEVLDCTLSDFHGPEEWAALRDQYATCVAEGTSVVRECAFKTRTGDERLGLVSGTRFSLEGRDVLMVSFRDLTELRRAERALQRAEERLRTVVAGAPIVLFAVDRDGIITLSEGRALAALGAKPGEHVGRSAYLLYRHLPEFARYIRQALGGEEFETVIDMGGISLETRYSPLRNASGTIEGVIGVSTNVTDRMRAERALRDSEARKSAVLDTALDCVITIDHEGRVTEFNHAAERTFGYTREEAMGRELAELIIPPSLREEHRRGMARLQATGVGPVLGRRIETTAMRADGSEFPVELSVTKIERSNPPSYTGYIRDLTERKEAEAALKRSEEQLRQAQKMEAIGLLAGGVAHDFNNLLTVILTQGQLLMKHLEPGSPAWQMAESIQGATTRGALLTRQLLTFSRNEVLAPEILDLNAVVIEMDRMLRRLIGEDIEVRCVPAAAPIRVRADRGQLEQVVMNLAANARDAMPDGGQLTIEIRETELDETLARELSVDSPGRFAVLEVRDTGSGMDAETQGRLFEPFFTTKARGKGTGLGLSTAYGIAKQAGGSIIVSSEPGKGATFTVLLPLLEGRPAASPPERAEPEMARGAETILLVEDEPAVRAIGRDLLEYNGYKVLDAENGAAAVDVAAGYAGPIHLLLTDVVMPKMGGREIAERLRVERPGIKILFISGFTDDTVVRHGVLEAGVAFLQKPFTLEVLSRKVREVLDQKPGTNRPDAAPARPRGNA
jgi:two-component system, cell cycle sensor histidine kinase and response regulator CckA